MEHLYHLNMISQSRRKKLPVLRLFLFFFSFFPAKFGLRVMPLLLTLYTEASCFHTDSICHDKTSSARLSTVSQINVPIQTSMFVWRGHVKLQASLIRQTRQLEGPLVKEGSDKHALITHVFVLEEGTNREKQSHM